MTAFLHDVRNAWRQWRTVPGVAVVAILALALGIGSTVSVFSFVNAFLLRPLPFRDPGRLVHVWETDRARSVSGVRASLPNAEDWAKQTQTLSELALFNYTEENLGGPEAERIPVGRVSANVFDILGIAPLAGRVFERGEDQPGRAAVAVLSFELWARRYQRDPGVLGRQIVLNDRPHEIVGVMPEGFHFPLNITQVWAPHVLDGARYPRTARTFQVVGRLAPTASIADAQADLARIAAALERQYPDSNRSTGVHVVPLRRALNFAFDIFQPMSIALSAAVVLVLLVACANVASVLLARAIGRRREIAIRLALGSSRTRLVRQLLTESALIAFVGGAGGALFASYELAILDAAIPADIYRVGRLELDPPALVFALAMAVLTALLVGFAPAWRSSRTDLQAAINESAHVSAPQSRRAQSSLVAAQLALTVALLVAAALMLQSVVRLQRVDPGFEPRVLSAKIVLPRESYPDNERLLQFHDRVLDEVRRTPGIAAASIVNYLPLNHETDLRAFAAGSSIGAERPPLATAITVAPGYFETLRIAVRRGRALTDDDRPDAARVAVVNEALARRFFADRDPIGERLSFVRRDGNVDTTIVGVVADSHFQRLAGAVEPQIYIPQAQEPWRYLRILARGNPGPPGDLVPSIRRAIDKAHPGLPLSDVRTLADVVDEFVLPQRGLSAGLAALAGGALVLALVGIYGVMAYFVSQRRRELAIRMTLGAAPHDIGRLVLARSGRITAIGVGLGIFLALGLGQLLATFLFGVSSTDLLTVGSTAAGVATIALLASSIPMRRASRVDPIETLRRG